MVSAKDKVSHRMCQLLTSFMKGSGLGIKETTDLLDISFSRFCEIYSEDHEWTIEEWGAFKVATDLNSAVLTNDVVYFKELARLRKGK